MAGSRNSTAKFAQVLEYMDGPQVVLLARPNDNKIIGVATKHEGQRHKFFGAYISADQWERYRRGFIDLRFLFMFPRWKEWYSFEFALNQKQEIELKRVPKDQNAEENYIPESGFFAYDHSEPIQSTESKGLSTQRYYTDGIWDLPDFGEFYNKVTDLYAFHLALDKYSAPNMGDNVRGLIKEAFKGAPLAGGSSYVNLYSDLVASQIGADRLIVGKLQYASPGEVAVRGREDIFREMRVSFEQFSANYETVKGMYKTLHGFLAETNLLRMDSEEFETESKLGDYILNECKAFSGALSLEKPDLVYDLTDKNPLRFAKILLAHFRRLERYFMFFAEGRVKPPEIS